MIKAIVRETISKTWVSQHGIDGIISDNRLGVFSKIIPSVFITHQLQVMTGSTTWLSANCIKYYKKNIQNAGFPIPQLILI
jgi:hypothetical protein